MDWAGTSWLVVNVAGDEIPTEERARLTFGVERIEVALPCGAVTDRLVIEDTTQQANGLLGDEAVATACSGHVSPFELDQLRALRDARQWRVESDNLVVLEGGPEVVLIRDRGDFAGH